MYLCNYYTCQSHYNKKHTMNAPLQLPSSSFRQTALPHSLQRPPTTTTTTTPRLQSNCRLVAGGGGFILYFYTFIHAPGEEVDINNGRRATCNASNQRGRNMRGCNRVWLERILSRALLALRSPKPLQRNVIPR